MTKKLKKSDLQGFTIIEVMIVLAVAAMILLIVLLAVPALQRNSRNTAIKNDASAVAAAINTYESDNNGVIPTYVDSNSSTDGSVTIGSSAGCGTAPSTGTEIAKVQPSTKVVCVDAAPTSPPEAGEIDVLKGTTCEGSSSLRAFSIYYSIETSGGNSQQCVDT